MKIICFKRSLKAQALPAHQVSPGHICQKLAGGRMVGFLHVDLLLQRQQGQSREIGTSWAPCDQIHSSAGGWMMLYSPLLAFVTCFAISLPGCQAGVSGNDFWDFGNGNGNSSTHSQILGTGMGMKLSIPNFWEWEREWKFPSRLLGTGMRR